MVVKKTMKIEALCGFVLLYYPLQTVLQELSDIGGDFAWIFPQYTVEARESVKDDPRAAEAEHKKQEEVLRRYAGSCLCSDRTHQTL